MRSSWKWQILVDHFTIKLANDFSGMAGATTTGAGGASTRTPVCAENHTNQNNYAHVNRCQHMPTIKLTNAATKASKVWFSYSGNCTLADGAVFHSVCQVWLSSAPPGFVTFSISGNAG